MYIVNDWNFMSAHSGTKVFCSENTSLIDCNICGFVHMDPLPDHSVLEKIYEYDYYSIEKADYITNQEKDRDWWMANYSNRIKQIESYGSGTKGRILDIGSGPGLFLEAAAQLGWSAIGLEPNKLAAQHARSNGCDVLELFLSVDNIPKLGKFDAIHCSEVLEHILNPHQILNIMHQLLNPGGVVYCLVPNDFNPIQSIYTQKNNIDKWWVSTPHHINYFNHLSLKNIFSKNNFEIVYLTSTFPIDLFLLMNLNYVGNNDLGGFCHDLRKNLELNMFNNTENTRFLDDLYLKLSEIGIGREAIVISKKNTNI